MLNHWFQRFCFAIRYKTFKRLIALEKILVVCGPKGAVFLPKRCPHQGAPLVQFSHFEGDHLVCGWHGCRYSLKEGQWIQKRECSK